ncbi:MAG: hypothetical protein ACRDK3_11790 [Actinomycetota bacterium]
MFVTRAGRHDRSDLKEFIESRRGGEVDLTQGTAMIAREGSIIGCIRLIELDPQTLVYDDLFVAESHDDNVAKQLVQAALNNKGGTVYSSVGEGQIELLSSLGFSIIDRSDAPEPVAAYWSTHPGPVEDAVHLKAR